MESLQKTLAKMEVLPAAQGDSHADNRNKCASSLWTACCGGLQSCGERAMHCLTTDREDLAGPASVQYRRYRKKEKPEAKVMPFAILHAHVIFDSCAGPWLTSCNAIWQHPLAAHRCLPARKCPFGESCNLVPVCSFLSRVCVPERRRLWTPYMPACRHNLAILRCPVVVLHRQRHFVQRNKVLST